MVSSYSTPEDQLLDDSFQRYRIGKQVPTSFGNLFQQIG